MNLPRLNELPRRGQLAALRTELRRVRAKLERPIVPDEIKGGLVARRNQLVGMIAARVNSDE